jgi:hypothetical protein
MCRIAAFAVAVREIGASDFSQQQSPEIESGKDALVPQGLTGARYRDPSREFGR